LQFWVCIAQIEKINFEVKESCNWIDAWTVKLLLVEAFLKKLDSGNFRVGF
jgi:hypothetical protein